MKLKRIGILLLSLLFFSSCDDNDSSSPALIVEANLFRTVRAETLKEFVNAADVGFSDEIKFDVDIYKVVYKTTYKDESIEASGLVILPQKKANEEFGMVSFQHGTIVSHSDAPSLVQAGDVEANLYASLSSAGFIVVVPDFIGFGASSEIAHPYYVEKATADAVTDNLKAAAELAQQKNVKFNEKLFLAGYSQGGYATLAAHKFIEESGLSGFNLVASFPAAGGYDVTGMQKYFFSLDQYSQPFYLGYVAHAYTSYYEWTQPYTNFFKEPYAGKIDQLFDGSKSASQINSALTNEISALVNQNLLLNIGQPTFDYIRVAFGENSLTDWTPAIPVYFYHGDQDTTVPYQNSVETYDQLILNGTSSSTISLTTLPGANHSTGILPYLEKFVPVLISLK